MSIDETQRLQVLAYREEDGRPDGRAEEHWKKAEQQLEIEFRFGFRDDGEER